MAVASDFKVGDKARVLVNNTNSTDLMAGDIVTIKELRKSPFDGIDVYTTGKDGTPATRFPERGWFVSTASLSKVDDPDEIKVGDEVTYGGYSEQYVVEAMNDTHVWVLSKYEAEQDYSNPYYTFVRDKVKAAPAPKWEVGKTYRAYSFSTPVTVTAVDEEGNALLRLTYEGEDETYVSSKRADQRSDYKEV